MVMNINISQHMGRTRAVIEGDSVKVGGGLF